MSVPIAVSRALYKGLMSATREFSRRGAPMLLRLPVEQANIGWMRDGRAQSEYVNAKQLGGRRAIISDAAGGETPGIRRFER